MRHGGAAAPPTAGVDPLVPLCLPPLRPTKERRRPAFDAPRRREHSRPRPTKEIRFSSSAYSHSGKEEGPNRPKLKCPQPAEANPIPSSARPRPRRPVQL